MPVNILLIRALLSFYEYFHGDNGAGLGASHRNGWTGLVGNLVEFFGRVEATQFLRGGKATALTQSADKV